MKITYPIEFTRINSEGVIFHEKIAVCEDENFVLEISGLYNTMNRRTEFKFVIMTDNVDISVFEGVLDAQTIREKGNFKKYKIIHGHTEKTFEDICSKVAAICKDNKIDIEFLV